MNLIHLSDDEVEKGLSGFVRAERESLSGVLHYLREVERRRLHSKHKCSSLFEFAMKVHGYSEPEANSRISAMRLLKELPEIEEKIESGALSLTNLNSARAMFRKEKKASIQRSRKEKIEVLEKLENRSKKEAKRVLEKESFLEPSFDLEMTGTERTFFSDNDELEPKLKRLFELKARSNPNMSLRDLVNAMADECLPRWDPLEKAKRGQAKKERQQTEPSQSPRPDEVKPVLNQETPSLESEEKPSRYAPATVRHAVYMRDQGRCQNCGSGRATEIDHVVPFAMGGMSDLENLRLLCRSCNQRHAIRSYGSNKMQSFLRAPVVAYH